MARAANFTSESISAGASGADIEIALRQRADSGIDRESAVACELVLQSDQRGTVSIYHKINDTYVLRRTLDVYPGNARYVHELSFGTHLKLVQTNLSGSTATSTAQVSLRR